MSMNENWQEIDLLILIERRKNLSNITHQCWSSSAQPKTNNEQLIPIQEDCSTCQPDLLENRAKSTNTSINGKNFYLRMLCISNARKRRFLQEV